MVEIIMGLHTEYPAQLNLNNITSIKQAEQIAGFDLLVPSVIPEGFVFTRAVYEPEVKRVRLFYQPQEGTRLTNGVSLMISESQDTGQPWSWVGYPPEALEEVLINGNRATFGRGSFANGTYQPDDNLYLVWDTPKLSIQMVFRASSSYPTRLEKDDLLAIAESME